jgi:hypothetical protein
VDSLAEKAAATAAFVADALPGVTTGDAAGMLAEAEIDVQHPQRLRMLHRFLTDHPQAFTAAPAEASAVFNRLAQTLHRHGHTSVPLLGCAGCGAHDRPFKRRDDHGRPLCDTCYRPPPRRCGRCGRTRTVRLRGRDGQPDLCTGCHQGHVQQCSICGRTRVAYRAPNGALRCQGCIPRPPRACVECGRSAAVQAEWPIGPVCSGCYDRVRANPAPCPACRRSRPLIAATSTGQRICGGCAGASNDHACQVCGTAGDLYSQRTCARCVLADRLHTWIAAQAPNHHQFQPLVTSLGTTPKPRSVISWLSTSPVPPLLRDLADRPDPITHDLLDTITPSTTTLHNARSLLVESGVLPPRVEYLDRITPWLEHVLSTVPADDARLVRQFTNWWLLRRARSRSRTRPYTSAAADGVRNQVTTAIGFLAWLRAEATDLPRATQAHIDLWLTDGPRHRRILRAFIHWARQRHLVTDLDVPPIPVAAPSHLQDDQDQWQQLHRCLHETTMPVHLRVVGALVLLFGLSVTRLTTLTVGQIEQDETGTHLLLTGHRLLVPTALARLLIAQRTQAAGRWAVTTTAGADRPLFPGLHGRPTHPEVLRAKLKEYGIRPRASRNTALAALAADLPPAVLADLFGIGLTTATRWASHARRDWAPYLAERVGRAQPTDPPFPP